MLTTLKLLALPAALTTAYLLHLHHQISEQTNSKTQLFTPENLHPSIKTPSSFPPTVTSNPECLIAHERVQSHPIHLAHLNKTPLDRVLTRYIRATMTSFSHTPQIFLFKRMIPHEDKFTAQTFEQVWIQKCNFDVGDRVNGLWKVAYRGSVALGEERIELAMDAPEGYWGPVVQGVVVVGVRRVGDEFVFVNETWMWRGRDEKEVLLESAAGRWFHRLLSGWLVGRGVGALRDGEKEE